MPKNKFLLHFQMNILLRFILSGMLIAAFLYTGNTHIFPESTASSIQLWWIMMMAGSIFIILATLGTVWHWSGLLSASFIVGISSQLGLNQPLWFQYIQIIPSDKFPYLLYATIAVQAIFALWAHLSYGLLSATHRLITSLSFKRTIFFILLLLGISIPAMRYIGNHNYIGLLGQSVFAGAFLLINMASLFALSRALPERTIKNIFQHIEHSLSLPNTTNCLRIYDRYLPSIVALWVLLISVLLCILAFEQIAHVPDEIAYLFQAKYLLLGHVAVPAPILPEAFAYDFLPMRDTLWFSIFPPGWPAVLALGVLFNLAWLVNPVLAAANIFLAHAFFKKISSQGYANIIILLLAVSPWFILMAASQMSHILTMTLALAAWLSLLNAQEKNNILFALLGGIFMGFLFLTRPLDGLLLGILTGLWILSFLKKGTSWTVIAGYCIGCIAIGSLVFPYNNFLTGSPLLTPINQYFGELWSPGANRLGFGLDIGPPNQWNGIDLYRGHNIWEALINFQQNSYSMNFDLFGWGIGSLSMFLVHILWGKWTRNELYLLAIIVVTTVAYSLYWFSGSFYIGPRYWFICILPLTALTASGISTLVQKFQPIPSVTLPTQRFGVALIVLCSASMMTTLTWRGVSKYYEFRGFHTDYRNILSENDMENSLIFVKTNSKSDFASAFMYNSPDFSSSDPIFARDLGSESNRVVVNAFPDRSIYYINGRLNKRSHARITLGPVSGNILYATPQNQLN